VWLYRNIGTAEFIAQPATSLSLKAVAIKTIYSLKT
jgi:hypothetical protein